MQEYRDYNIYGAVAYLRDQSGSAALAEKEQLFVIRAKGRSVSIVNNQEFVPKAF